MAAHRKYNWELWFGQATTKLIRGVDYQIPQAIMWQTVRDNARRRGVSCRVTDTHDGILIEVQDAVPYTDKTTITS